MGRLATGADIDSWLVGFQGCFGPGYAAQLGQLDAAADG